MHSMRGCSASAKLVNMMILTTSYMVVELVVGNLTNSMALVADSFHMLSDLIALIIAFVSVRFDITSIFNNSSHCIVQLLLCYFRLSTQQCDTNTFGWARAEVVGALVNAVFLFALCFTITVQAVKRFVLPEKIEKPEMILIVGGVGLFINIVGLVIFGHSHGGEKDGHGHGHSRQHGHHDEEGCDKDSGPSGHQMNIKVVK